jgi:hypothetical protein
MPVSHRNVLAPILFSTAFVVLGAIGSCAKQALPGPTPPSASAPPPKQKSKLVFAGTVGVPQRRAVRGQEMTTAIAVRAREILDANSGAPYGTEVPFEVDGQSYIGRIEEHYHEPGGPRKPWGRHRGVTVYHADSP